MVVGFNHNFRYKGEIYHVQTEDGGLKSPNIVTLLYCGGTILSSQKTSYSDITKVNNLEQVVEDLMKEQHKEMLRRLKDGEFDDRLKGHGSVVDPSKDPEIKTVPTPAPASVEEPASPVESTPLSVPEMTPEPAPAPQPASAQKPSPKPADEQKEDPVDLGLDDIILSYLVGDDK